MDRNILVFALLLVFLGAGFGFYVLSLFGLILLIPAFLWPSRPPVRPVPVQQKQEMRRITPPLIRHPETAPAAAPAPVSQGPMIASSAPGQPQSYAGSLFPTSMFPPLTQIGTQPQPTAGKSPEKQQGEDDLIEAGALLLLLRLVLG